MDPDAVRTLVEARGISVLGEIWSSFDEDDESILFIAVQRTSAGVQSPSNTHIAAVAKVVRELGFSVRFAPIFQEDLEVEMNEKIEASVFSNKINVIFSAQNRRLTPIVFPLIKISETENLEIHSFIKEFLETHHIDANNPVFITDDELPTQTSIIKQLRIISPATVIQLSASLEKAGYGPIAAPWLELRLRELSQASFVVACRDSSYALSLRALKALGSAKGRSSPDVHRILELARQRT